MNEQQSYYETMYILRPDIAEDEVTNHIDKYNKLLEEFGGTILDSQMRGKRRLAYQISKHREGIYVQLSHQGDGQHIFKIEKAMRLSEDVIRYMTVKQEGPLPTPRSSHKSKSESENKEIPNKNVEAEEKKLVTNPDVQTAVNGRVKIRLHKGNAIVIGRMSENNSLYREDLATYSKDDVFNHSLAEGFIYMWGMSNKIWAELNSKIKD